MDVTGTTAKDTLQQAHRRVDRGTRMETAWQHGQTQQSRQKFRLVPISGRDFKVCALRRVRIIITIEKISRDKQK
jgi:hypothetical protein